MVHYRSRTTTHGRNMAGARSLWRATGLKDSDFGKPIIAVANSFTQFVPGHVHLKELGQLVCQVITQAGGIGREFNTIAIDDGIAMGHSGMLYSLPSRELIADAVEYMVNAHCADALVCISNCDKITPGMLMAALRLNIPTIFVSGGPMEAGRIAPSSAKKQGEGQEESTLFRPIDLVTSMVSAANPSVSEEESLTIERSACPTCGSCSGMFTANSMNCLTEALGLSLPGNGTLIATHKARRGLFEEAGRRIVDMARRYYEKNDITVLPRYIANMKAFENAMSVDIAMGGSTNTVLHLLAAAYEGEVPFTMQDIDRLSRKVPHLCKVSPSHPDVHMEDVHRAGGIPAIMGELDRLGLLHRDVAMVHVASLSEALKKWDIRGHHPVEAEVEQFFRAAPGGKRTTEAFSQEHYSTMCDIDGKTGAIREGACAYNQDGGLAVLYGNLAEDGAIVKTAGVAAGLEIFAGPARVFESQEAAVSAILGDAILPGDVVLIRYEGPRGGPGMQEMLYPTSYLKSKGLAEKCALITDGRFSGGTSGLSIGHISPEAAEGGLIGLVEEGDRIEIDIPARTLKLVVPENELAVRRERMNACSHKEAWQPKRHRVVSKALQAYALLTTSAARGAVRDITRFQG